MHNHPSGSQPPLPSSPSPEKGEGLWSKIQGGLRQLANQLRHSELRELEHMVLDADFMKHHGTVRKLAPKLIEQATAILGEADVSTLLGHSILASSYLNAIPTDRLKAIAHYETVERRAKERLEKDTLDEETRLNLTRLAMSAERQLNQLR